MSLSAFGLYHPASASGQTDASIDSDFIGADELRFAYAQGIRFDF